MPAQWRSEFVFRQLPPSLYVSTDCLFDLELIFCHQTSYRLRGGPDHPASHRFALQLDSEVSFPPLNSRLDSSLLTPTPTPASPSRSRVVHTSLIISRPERLDGAAPRFESYGFAAGGRHYINVSTVVTIWHCLALRAIDQWGRKWQQRPGIQLLKLKQATVPSFLGLDREILDHPPGCILTPMHQWGCYQG